MAFSIEVETDIDFSKLERDVLNEIKNAVDDCGADLRLTAQRLAPVDSGQLERSIVKSQVTGTGDRFTVSVSAKALRRGYNYARRMDQDSYNLGERSRAKARSQASVKSKFMSVQKLSVGKGYLTRTAKACERGYAKHIDDGVSNAVRIFNAR